MTTLGVALPFNPAMAPLSANLINALVTLEWAPGLSEAISTYTPPPDATGLVEDRNLVPAAAGQQELLTRLIDGIEHGQREAEQIPALFAALRDSAMTAEALAAERNFYSAAVVFRDVAEAVLTVSNSFKNYGPRAGFCAQGHDAVVASFLRRRAADMFLLGRNYNEAAEEWGKVPVPDRAMGVWERAADYYHHRGDHAGMARALYKKVYCFLRIGGEPNFAILTDAVGSVWAYERARADGTRAVNPKAIVMARLQLADVLERMDLLSFAREQLDIVEAFYQPDDETSALLRLAKERLSEKIVAVEVPGSIDLSESSSNLYPVALALLKTGRIDRALELLELITHRRARLDEWPARAERNRRVVLWLRGVSSADWAMTEGRKKESLGDSTGALSQYGTVSDFLKDLVRTAVQQSADERTGLIYGPTGVEEMIADAAVAIARVTANSNLFERPPTPAPVAAPAP